MFVHWTKCISLTIILFWFSISMINIITYIALQFAGGSFLSNQQRCERFTIITNKLKNGYCEILKDDTDISGNSISNTLLIWIWYIWIKSPVQSTFHKKSKIEWAEENDWNLSWQIVSWLTFVSWSHLCHSFCSPAFLLGLAWNGIKDIYLLDDRTEKLTGNLIKLAWSRLSSLTPQQKNRLHDKTQT